MKTILHLLRLFFAMSFVNSEFAYSAGGVVNGQPVNATITNAAFLFKNANDSSPFSYTLGGLNITGLTASRACVTDASNNIASSSTTSTQLAYLSGATGTTGSGSVVLGTGPTLAGPTVTGTLAGANETLSGTMAVGSGASLVSTDQVYAQESYTNPSTIVRGARITPRAASTSGANANPLIGVLSLPAILGTNTQNWTSTNPPGLLGFYADYRALSGSTGTISISAGVYSRLQNSGSMTVSANHGIYADNPLNSGTITGNAGVTVVNQTVGTNNTNLLLGTATIPSGSWSIYNASSNNNALSGNVRIGSTTAPTVALDVTGAASVSGNATVGSQFIVTTSASPASGAACTAGRIVWDSSFIYVCTASGAWKRAALTGGY